MGYWDKNRYKLKRIYEEKGITRCENCNSGSFLTFAHRHKRRWYLATESLLIDFNQTLLLCVRCHDKIEYNKEYSEEMFLRLRGEEDEGRPKTP